MSNKKSNSNRVVRLFALLAIVAMLTGMAPGRTLAARAQTDSYESTTYGFSAEWDADVWTAEEIDGSDGVDGISINSSYSWGSLQGVAWEDIDPEACLEYMAETFGGADSVQDFRKASRKIEAPTSELGGEANLYTMTMSDSGDELEMVMYLECATIDNDQAALMVMLATSLQGYDETIVEWNDLLAGISIDSGNADASNGDDTTADSADSSATGDSAYVSDDFGFSVDADPSVWTTEGYSDENGDGLDVESELVTGVITATATEGATLEECPITFATQLEENQAYKRVRKAPSTMERPETDPNASAELYTMLDKSSPTKIAVYFECRELPVKDYFLTVRLITVASDYEDALPEIQDLLDSISIDEAADTHDSKPSGEPYVSPNFGITIDYDTDVWTVSDISDDESDTAMFESDFGNLHVVAVNSDVDLQGCVDTLIDAEQEYAKGDIEVAGRTFERPELTDGAEGELYRYTLDSDDGPLNVVIYVECRSIAGGEAVLGITFFTTADLYEDVLPELQAFLDGVDAGS